MRIVLFKPSLATATGAQSGLWGNLGSYVCLDEHSDTATIRVPPFILSRASAATNCLEDLRKPCFVPAPIPALIRQVCKVQRCE